MTNTELLYASGLLHDLKKGIKKHAEEASKVFEKMGFSRLAEIVKNHMDIHEAYLTQITEEAVLYYSDKIVKGTSLIRLENRIIPEKEKNEMIKKHMKKRLENAKRIEKQIETILDIPLFDFVLEKVRGLDL